MQRRSFIHSVGLALPLTSLPMGFNPFNLSAYDMKLLRRNVGIFTEKGGTMGWLIQPDSMVVIDSQFREQAEHFIGEVKQ